MLCIFRLDHSFVRQYAKKPVPWGWKSGPNSLGEIVCMRTYSRVRPETGKNESWHQICERVINGVFRMLERHVRTLRLEWDEGHAQRTAQEMYDRLFHMKFMPPGRGLWSMGTDITEKRDLYAALFNCFTGDTKFITKEFGPISFAEVVDQKVTVLTLYGWKSALVSRFGKQYINSITFAPAIPNTRAEGFRPARSNYRVHVKATANHRWILANGKETTNLHEGAFVKLNRGVANTDSLEYKEGFVHGLIFADGQMSYEASTHYSHVMRLCGKKNKYKTLFSNVTMPPSANGDCYVHVKSKTNYKELPANVNCDYESGFLSGLIAGDASQPKCETTKILSTQRADLVAWLKDHAAFAGYTITGINTDTHPTNFGERAAPLYKISLSTCKYSAWVVTRVEVTGAQEPVFCATVPETGSFTLASGVYTGNCAFTSTKDIITEKHRPFTFAMDALMLGIGVGFDVKGAGKINVKKRKGKTVTHVIPDSREGWVEALQMLLQSFFEGTNPIEFDTSKIRKAGLPIKGFGGKSSGPAPLIKLFEQIDEIMTKQAGKPITERNIVDIFNMIGCCVVAGNIRRSAEIAIGPVDSEEFIDLKNYDKNPERAMFGWTSNNSVEAVVGMDYKSLCERIIKNGEPGFLWLENARNYGRIVDGIDRRDIRIEGTNPCGEIGLESYELCNLVELFPCNCESEDDFMRTIKFAYLYAKIITLSTTQWSDSNRVMLRNRRIGVGLGGIQQFIAKRGINTFRNWCLRGYKEIENWDQVYSEWLCIPRSIKKTTVKPSGTISLLAGATPGMHWSVFNYHIRRIRVAIGSELHKILAKAGYHIEDAVNEANTVVVEIPVEPMIEMRTEEQVSMWEQLEMTAFLQHYWADNQVSCTVKFDPEKEGPEMARALEYYQYHLKGISFLPKPKKNIKIYPQMPYEPITKEEYLEKTKNLRKVDFTVLTVKEGGSDKYCSNDTCTL